VNLVLRDGDKSVFHLSQAEKSLLFKILKLYPLVPAQHHRSSRVAKPQASTSDQVLLEEALAERRRENQRQLTDLLGEKRRFEPTEDGYHVTLTGSEMEWLLQVLNDIRVGSWIALGEPGANSPKPVKLSGHSALHYAAMEFCGYLEMSLLDAFRESK
jgi:hypothetical protein